MSDIYSTTVLFEHPLNEKCALGCAWNFYCNNFITVLS
jgi:hypothetical protein